MQGQETNIKDFTTQVRQLILNYQALKKENAELYAMVDERDKQIAVLEEDVAKHKRDYESLMAVKMLNINDEQLVVTKKRVSSLIRNINSCIAMLSEQKEEDSQE